MSKDKWPQNSKFYLAIKELREAMPKLNFTKIYITKPTKPRRIKGV